MFVTKQIYCTIEGTTSIVGKENTMVVNL